MNLEIGNYTETQYSIWRKRASQKRPQLIVTVFKFDGAYHSTITTTPTKTLPEMIRQIQHNGYKMPIVYSEFHGRYVFGMHIGSAALAKAGA